jgi:hypothetical protein
MALLIKDPAPSLRPRTAYALPLNSVDKDGQAIFSAAKGLNRIVTVNIEHHSE